MSVKINTIRFILIALFALSLGMVHRLLFPAKGIIGDQVDFNTSVVSGSAFSFSALAGICLVALLCMPPQESDK